MKSKLKNHLFAAVFSLLLVVVIILVNVVLYSLTAINGWYIAYAEEIDLTVSGNTKELFADAEAEGKKVKIMFCMAEDDLAMHTTGKDVLDTAKQLEALHPSFIELVFYNIKTQQDADGNLVDLRKYETDMAGNKVPLHSGSVIFSTTVSDGFGGVREDYRVVSTEYNGVPFVDFYHIDADGYITAYNGEEFMASMILWTLADEHKTAYFTTGHGESVDVAFYNMLVCAGYYVEPLDLLRNDFSTEMLEKAGFVIISNPTADFAKGKDAGMRTEIERLEYYLKENGGALYVSLDPYASPLVNLESLLSDYGITVATGKNADGNTVRRIVKDARNAITTDGYTFVANYADTETGAALAQKTDAFVPDDVVVKDVGELVLSGSAEPVLMTSSGASSVLDGDTEGGSFCVGALSKMAATNGKTARVFVTSGIYLTASDAVISDSYANRNFVYALFDEVFGASIAPYGCRIVPYNTEYLEDLTMGTAGVYTALIMAVPIAAAVVGIVINKRRKNR